jgi:hypothetical protein
MDLSDHAQILYIEVFEGKEFNEKSLNWPIKSVTNEIFLLHSIFVYNTNNPTNIVYNWRKFWNPKS